MRIVAVKVKMSGAPGGSLHMVMGNAMCQRGWVMAPSCLVRGICEGG